MLVFPAMQYILADSGSVYKSSLPRNTIYTGNESRFEIPIRSCYFFLSVSKGVCIIGDFINIGQEELIPHCGIVNKYMPACNTSNIKP